MGVIRTLLDRCETLVTEEEDKQKEREHIKETVTRCGYLQWTISTVQGKIKTKKEDNIIKRTVEKDKSKGMVITVSPSSSSYLKKIADSSEMSRGEKVN